MFAFLRAVRLHVYRISSIQISFGNKDHDDSELRVRLVVIGQEDVTSIRMFTIHLQRSFTSRDSVVRYLFGLKTRFLDGSINKDNDAYGSQFQDTVFMMTSLFNDSGQSHCTILRHSVRPSSHVYNPRLAVVTRVNLCSLPVAAEQTPSCCKPLTNDSIT